MARMRYMCRFPGKYAGDPQRIFARSRFELAYMQALDSSNVVAKWISEPKTLNITYVSPIDRKTHEYWPDFMVQYLDGSVELIEFKPLKEALAENAHTNYDKIMVLKNAAKWAAADHFARSIGARFKVITEKNFFRRRSSTKPKRPRTTRPARRTRGSL